MAQVKTNSQNTHKDTSPVKLHRRGDQYFQYATNRSVMKRKAIYSI